jgi:nitroreductase
MFIELARERRSVRAFTEQKVERAKIEQIIETALRSPSGRGRRPYHLTVVDDRILIDKLAVAKEHGGTFLKSAQLAIVVCGEPQKSDMWIEDSTIAAVTMQYAVSDLGLGSCWVHMRDRNYNEKIKSTAYIAELLNLPEELEVLCILAVGYSAQTPAPLDHFSLKYKQVSLNNYQIPFKKD